MGDTTVVYSHRLDMLVYSTVNLAPTDHRQCTFLSGWFVLLSYAKLPQKPKSFKKKTVQHRNLGFQYK